MNILMLGWELPPHNSGGLGVACLNLAKALVRDGLKIDFVVPYFAEHKDIDFMRILPAMKIDPINRFGGAYESGKIEEKFLPSRNKFISIRDIQYQYIKFVKKYLKKHRPDMIHAHDWLTFEAGISAKKEYGLPFVAHVHATEFDRSGMNGGNPLILEIEREGLMQADRIVAVSKNTRQIIHQRYQIPLEKIDIAYNSLDEGFYGNECWLKKDNYEYLAQKKQSGYKIVSTVGRFTIQKGLSHLMKAASLAIKHNPKLIFVFAGDGEERDQLLMKAAEYKIIENVVFTGFIRGQRLRDVYSLSDIFVMSSVSEPFGLTALEAAHHENVLILTKQSGVSEVIKSSMLYDFWDEEKLANEILAISENQVLYETLKSGVKKEYLKISWSDVARKITKVYNDLYKYNRNLKLR